IAEVAIGDAEICGTLFEQNSARPVVAPGCVARSAVAHAYAIDCDVMRLARQHGKARDIPEPDILNIQTVDAPGQYSIATGETREGRVISRQSRANLDSVAITVDGEIAQ